ncbi:unnamed protein product, partial [Vitis vinifera]
MKPATPCIFAQVGISLSVHVVSSILYDCSKVLLRGNVSYYGLSHQQSASYLLNFKGTSGLKVVCIKVG